MHVIDVKVKSFWQVTLLLGLLLLVYPESQMISTMSFVSPVMESGVAWSELATCVGLQALESHTMIVK